MSLYNIILIGEAGTGKSSLSDLLVGDNLFVVSDKPECCTKETICKTSLKDPEIGIIDTPGLQDDKGSDKEHYEQMVKIIKSLKNLNLVLVVLNYANCRLTSSIQYMLRFLCYLFPQNISDNIAIVFTHYDAEYERARAKKKKINNPRSKFLNEYIPAIMNLITETTGQQITKKLPTFFLDSEFICEGELVEKDENTLKEINILLGYAKTTTPIKIINEEANIKYKKKEEEFEEREQSKIEDNKKITTITKYKRIKYINYDNTINYSDWEVVGKPKITEEEIKDKKSDLLEYAKLANNVLGFLNKNTSSNGNGGSIFSSLFGSDEDSSSNENSSIISSIFGSNGDSSSYDNESLISSIADQVIRGDFGNGVDRKNRLKEAGFDYETVQKVVNSKLSKK